MPNTFAYIVLYSYPLVVFILFRKYPIPKALVWSILGGYLFLPQRAGIDLPMLPTLDKASIPALSAAFMIWHIRRSEARSPYARMPVRRNEGGGQEERRSKRARVPRRVSLLVPILCLTVLLGVFGTYWSNPEQVVWGPLVLPSMSLYDSFSMILTTLMMLLPLLLGRSQLGSPAAHLEILRALVQLGLVYSLLMLVEVRLSPQLSVWTYGFFPHSFLQHIRNGGFRPVVFLEHGLRVGIFMSMAVLAACALYRFRDGPLPGRWLLAALWLFIVLVLSKNLGALGITIGLIPVILLAGLRWNMAAAAVIAGLVLFYPLARGSGVVPVALITETAKDISEDRAQSFVDRLTNEERLLERANLKPAFGWGSWYRNGIFNEYGQQVSITDGIWIIEIGARGWIGYLGLFGLLTIPTLLMFWRSGWLAVDWVTAGLVVVMAANLIDLVPNSSLVPITWLIAGALAGRLELGQVVTGPKDRTPGQLQERSGNGRARRSGYSGRRVRVKAG